MGYSTLCECKPAIPQSINRVLLLMVTLYGTLDDLLIEPFFVRLRVSNVTSFLDWGAGIYWFHSIALTKTK